MKNLLLFCCVTGLLLGCSPKKEPISERMNRIFPEHSEMACYAPTTKPAQALMKNVLFTVSYHVDKQGDSKDAEQSLSFDFLLNEENPKTQRFESLSGIKKFMWSDNVDLAFGSDKTESPLAVNFTLDGEFFVIERFKELPNFRSKNLATKRAPFFYVKINQKDRFVCGVYYEYGDEDIPPIEPIPIYSTETVSEVVE
jgi:hypothetical protein